MPGGRPTKRSPGTDERIDYIAEPLRSLAVPIGDVNIDTANVRIHPEHNIDSIRASMARFGQRVPIVVQKQGMVVRAGNGRVVVARGLGWSHIAAVVVDESAVEAAAYGLADNRTAELAEWDDVALTAMLKALVADGFPIAEVGWSDEELEDMLGSFNVEVGSMGEIPSSDRDPIQQMTFTLHDSQVEQVTAALSRAKAAGPFVDTGNENSNGNALARIVEAYNGKG